MTLSRALVTLGGAALLLAGVAGADGAPLHGTVGPGFTITLQDGSGAAVTHLDAGSYTLTVDDRSEEHDFHLQGPGGVDVATEVETVGTKTFTVNLVDGTYTFVCDPHASRMHGSFTVGSVSAGSPPPKAAAPARALLTLTGRAITLTTPVGKPLKALPAGAVVISVRDRSATRGLQLRGAGLSKSTGVGFTGTVTWRGKLKAGTLTFASTGAKPASRGRVTVS
jgi:hypothetical protein